MGAACDLRHVSVWYDKHCDICYKSHKIPARGPRWGTKGALGCCDKEPRLSLEFRDSIINYNWKNGKKVLVLGERANPNYDCRR